MAQGRRKLIAGNWKMNGLHQEGLALARELSHRSVASHRATGQHLACDLLICPPATLLITLAEALTGSEIRLGGQDCHTEAKGAYTGEISAEMLKDAGCGFVIVGHSECRCRGDSDATVRRKAEAAKRAGLVVIVAVGESEAERNAGRCLEVVAGQLAGSIPDGMDADGLVVAYEPVWAIGTGKTATVADVAEMHAHIRATVAGRVAGADRLRLLYGGSVKPDNAAELLAVDNVDGALVGGASLVAADFWKIALACH